MFNRSGFNQVKFNTAANVPGAAASLLLRIGAGIRVEHIKPVTGIGALVLRTGCKAVQIKRTGALSRLNLGTSGRLVKRVPASMRAVFDLGTKMIHYAYGTEEIAFDGLVLHTGDELVIDTDLMTVTLNGVNIARYVSMNSKFIKLLAGANTLVWQDKCVTRTANIRVEWKPRWL
jgi:hypothetical protein